MRADHLSKWWYGLKERDVPRKLWIMRQGHVDPFDGRRAVWVDTIHRWFDHWLQGVQNGIMSEPAVDIEDVRGRVGDPHGLADPGHEDDRRLPAERGDGAAQGALGGSSGGAADTLTFTRREPEREQLPQPHATRRPTSGRSSRRR